MEIALEKYEPKDNAALFSFERDNRAYFEKMVPGRGEEYYNFHVFEEIMKSLLEEQNRGISYFYLIKNDSGEILGRMNLVDIENGNSGHLGYRVAEKAVGKGIATKAVQLLVKEARKIGMKEIHAKTTVDNIGSQKVLERNGFKNVPSEEVGFVYYFWKN
ncbi:MULTISPECIES: GNAT family N-acetyltransferase [unclassified Bacillus (in: firmicutes)]|uniref:GNAT family N-acetyltransferase n=1 Tax=unclassified Bacillus (in: firmicutes) TaxID=185979 RepID=UPI0008E6D355|nr:MULTISPECIES: GNAT family N-acetyltransferase [unclassified Bacillus (in: firmicutes)]SFB13865.1 ribosomal-protein-alanine N-acetyltransferase [Bacillus sp. UNCCL13]SFQ89886.1 ribosomal-protein-alanine N-acetyltransferase [Bacillus sp. cl95]